MGYIWVDAEDVLRSNMKEDILKDNDEDEIYLLIMKSREGDNK
jgi:hypothetical protein